MRRDLSKWLHRGQIGVGWVKKIQICAVVQVKRDHSCIKSVAAGMEGMGWIHHLSFLFFPIGSQ